MDFEILIDDLFANRTTDPKLSPIDNKFIISCINDYEDGGWRFSKFQSFIWDNVAETALSHRERMSMIDSPHTQLTAAAKSLQLTDKSKNIGAGSELAEIALYGIMRHHYKALPVVPKIFYKQNSQDPAKGADSVHIVVEGADNFSIWFGEAKFYNSIEDARLSEIVTSVSKSLQKDKLKKENSIITNVADIDLLIENKELLKRIREDISYKNSLDEIKSKIHIPIFILHECEITKKSTSNSKQYKDDVMSMHADRATAYFDKQIKKLSATYHKYADIKFHIILFPVPDKQAIVDKFISNVEHMRDQ